MELSQARDNDRRLRVLVVYPWGGGQAQYMRGFARGLAEFADVTLVTSTSYSHDVDDVDAKRWFFPWSDKMMRSKLRTVVRGGEYLGAWIRILLLVLKSEFDIVHIQWLLFYKLDRIMLRVLKRTGVKIVYTAHNAIPHFGASRHLSNLQAVYRLVDLIVVHGRAVQDEILRTFPILCGASFYLQPHGTYGAQDKSFNLANIPDDLKERVSGHTKKIVLMFGMQFHNKGSDRVLRYWASRVENEDYLLVLAGRTSGDFPELAPSLEEILARRDFLYIDEFVPDEVLNFLISSCHVVALPYRHASMSGVIFTAAEFDKTVIATQVGSFSDYLGGYGDSFLIENSDEAITSALDKVLDYCTVEELSTMGRRLGRRVRSEFTWDRIACDLVSGGYSKLV